MRPGPGSPVGSAPLVVDQAGANLTLSPYSGDVGSSATLNGTGFPAATNLSLSFGSTTPLACALGSNSTNSTGGFSCGFVVPSLVAGTYLVDATNLTVPISASTNFTIDPSTLALAPSSAYIGATVTASGEGFVPEATLTLQIGSTSITSCPLGGALSADASGEFSCSFPAPALAAGPYIGTVSDSVNPATAGFTLLAPTLLLTPNSGQVSSSVRATGVGYDPSVAISLQFNGAAVSSCEEGSLTSNSTGQLFCTLEVPAAPAGSAEVSAYDGYNTAVADYTVETPNLEVVPDGGVVGSTATVTGGGYAPDVTLSLQMDAVSIGSCSSGSLVSSSSGELDCSFTVPAAPGGPQSLTAYDGTNTAATSFTVQSSLGLSPATGTVGSGSTAAGTGFDADASFAVEWNASVTLCDGTTTSSGSFSCGFTVPASPAGAHTLTAVEGTFAPTAVFTVVPSFLFGPSAGPVGTSVSITAAGFDASSNYDIEWDSTVVASGTTDANGGVTTQITVPNAPGGAHSLGILEGSNSLSSTFTVTALLSVEPTAGIAGASVSLTGSGLAATTEYSYCLASSSVACPGGSATLTTDADGDVPGGTTLVVPSVSAGPYLVVVSSGSTVEVSAAFTVESAELTVSPTSGPVGATVTLSGSGFTVGGSYTYCFASSTPVCPSGSPTFLATGGGDVPSGTTLTVPSTPAGTYDVNVSSGSVFVTEASFLVSPSLVLTPTSGPAGITITATGTGFGASGAYSFMWNSSLTLCTGTSESDGDLGCSGDVPSVPAGDYATSLTQGSFVVTAEFTVVATAEVTPGSGAVGAFAAVSGTGFPASQSFSVSWNSSAEFCGGIVAVDGNWGCSAPVPVSAAGTYSLSASSGSQLEGVEFTVVPSFAVSASLGYVGNSVSVTGEGYNASQTYTVAWDSSVPLCSGTTDTLGDFGCTFVVPAAVAGAHSVSALQGTFGPAAQGYTVEPALSLNPASGVVGTPITATGTGFGGDAGVAVYWNGTTEVCSDTTQATGGFSCSFPAPSDPAADVPVSAIESSNEASTTFGLASSLVLSTNSGVVGADATATGAAFGPNAPYSILWEPSGAVICSGTTGSLGTFACAFTVPVATAGTHAVVAVQGSLELGSDFTVLPSGSLSVSSGEVGNASTFSGTGFDADAPIAVAWNSSTTLCSGVTNGSGSFSCSFVVPPARPGSYSLSVTEGAHTVFVPFTVSATPPSPSSSSGTPFPWDLVVLTLLLVVALLVALVYMESRRHRRPKGPSGPPARAAGAPPTLQPWVEQPVAPASSPAASSAPTAAVGGGATAVSPSPGTEADAEDIDVLIARLERMNEQLTKKKPPEIDDDSADASP